jgi:hypothetical protein
VDVVAAGDVRQRFALIAALDRLALLVISEFERSAHFLSARARSGKKNSLVFIAVASSQFVNPIFDIQKSLQLYLGIVNSVATIATFSSRVVFSSVEKIRPSSLEALLETVDDAKLRGAATALRRRGEKYTAVSPRLAGALIRIIASIPENRPVVQRILARKDVPLVHAEPQTGNVNRPRARSSCGSRQ